MTLLAQAAEAIQPLEHAPETLSFITVWVLHLGIPFVVIVIATTRALRARRRMRSCQELLERGALAPGEVAVKGLVEHGPGRDLAVRAVIEQEGVQKKTHIAWREVARDIEVEPFFLVTEDAERIRVEPTQEVMLADEVDRTEEISATRRRRIAELTQGETVFATGELVEVRRSGYRAADDDGAGEGAALVLRAPESGKLFLSTKPLDDAHGRQLKRERLYAICLTLCLVVLIGFDAGFIARSLVGERTTATLVHSDAHPVFTQQWRLKAKTSDGTIISDDVAPDHAHHLRAGDEVWVIRATRLGFLGQIGEHASIHTMLVQLSIPFQLMGILGYFLYCWFPDRPWYRQKKLIEVS